MRRKRKFVFSVFYSTYDTFLNATESSEMSRGAHPNGLTHFSYRDQFELTLIPYNTIAKRDASITTTDITANEIKLSGSYT